MEQLAEEYIANSDRKDRVFNTSYSESLFTFKVKQNIPLFNFFAPLIDGKIEKFYKKVLDNNFIFNKEKFYEDIVIDLLTSLSKIATRTLVLVLNIAREDEKLVGETSEDRYEYFVNTFLENPENLLSLYNTYPVLVDLIKKRTDDFFNYIEEILTAWKQDYELVNKYFGINAKEIVSIKMGLGDLHAGKSVAKVNFTDDICLVYKPRNAQVEIKFNGKR